jgi:hypothetical protein
MAFPATIRTTQASGYPGDLAIQFPPVAQPGDLHSDYAANNVIGRAFTHTGVEGVVAAGGAGAAGSAQGDAEKNQAKSGIVETTGHQLTAEDMKPAKWLREAQI